MVEISVIIPIYNTEMYLERCFESVLQQSFKNFEIIAIDDASLDGSAIICKDYEEKYPEIFRFYQKKENAGLLQARLSGIHHSVGRYVIFLDSDDFLDEDFLCNLHEAMKNSKADLLVSNIVFKYSSGEHFNMYSGLFKEKMSVEEYAEEMFLAKKFGWNVCAKMYRNEMLKKLDFSSNLTLGEDMYFNWELIKSNPQMVVSSIDWGGYIYAIRDNSSMKNHSAEEIQKLFRCMLNIYMQTKTFNEAVHFVMGQMLQLKCKKYLYELYAREIYGEEINFIQNEVYPLVAIRQNEQVDPYLFSPQDTAVYLKKQIEHVHNEIKSFCQKHEYIYIYGAGVYSEKVVAQMNNISIPYDAYILTNTQKVHRIINGLNVFGIDEVIDNLESENVGIMICMNKANAQSVKKILEGYGYSQYLDMSQYVEALGEYSL